MGQLISAAHRFGNHRPRRSMKVHAAKKVDTCTLCERTMPLEDLAVRPQKVYTCNNERDCIAHQLVD